MTSGRSDIYGHPELEVDLEEEVSFFSQIRRSDAAFHKLRRLQPRLKSASEESGVEDQHVLRDFDSGYAGSESFFTVRGRFDSQSLRHIRESSNASDQREYIPNLAGPEDNAESRWQQQHRAITNLQNRISLTAGLGNYSRTPELRVSHKLEERKRRSEMKELFDDLDKAVPNNGVARGSKWEILSKGILSP
jgi:hypothetical protein